ncbi:MAG: BadF/BadG/BcrA/BcrD ATPase family protein [Nocardioidaceae bacterium]
MSSIADSRGIHLGVDGGGTKTALVLLDSAGSVLASALAPSCYYLGHGIELVEQVLSDGVGAVCAQADLAPSDITHAFFALPGYGEVSADATVLDEIPSRVLGHPRYSCDNDMVAGWAGSLGAVDGVNVIAGTGSMTYGEHGARTLRVGGWGELFDDEGSAYWIAIRGLATFAQMSDGRLPRGPLRDLLIEQLGLVTDLDLVDVVLNRWHGDRSSIAALARTVADGATAGDTECGDILRHAGEALAGLVTATVDQLDFAADERVPVSWSGGVFASREVREAFRDRLSGTNTDLREPLLPPALGAALYAARLAGSPLEPAALARLQTHASTMPQGGHDE